MPKLRTEILALGGLAKWPRRCSAAEGTAACGARGRPPGLECSVPGTCVRARLKRRAPARLGAAATNCGPCPAPLCSAALQAPGAGASVSPAACAMRAPAASPMEGTAPLLRGRPDVSLAVGPRFRCCGGRVCVLDRTKCQAGGWLTFGSGKCGWLRALTPNLLFS